MFKNNHITYLLFSVLVILVMGCNKNNQDTSSVQNATVLQIKYACGTACDALGFVIKTNDNKLFTPIGLGMEFRINNLPIKIRYKYTGKLPERFTAPNYELIEILDITR